MKPRVFFTVIYLASYKFVKYLAYSIMDGGCSTGIHTYDFDVWRNVCRIVSLAVCKKWKLFMLFRYLMSTRTRRTEGRTEG